MFISDAFCRWEGSSTDEVGKNKETGKVLVRVNPKYYRPTEVVSTAHCSPNTVNPCGGFPGKHQMNVFHSLLKQKRRVGRSCLCCAPPPPPPPRQFCSPTPRHHQMRMGCRLCICVRIYLCMGSRGVGGVKVCVMDKLIVSESMQE